MTTENTSTPEQRGFALLVIFLIAAAVAFTMYEELPRAAFESVRDKEQILTDRGNQYRRAIQVFYAENKRYPAELKDLESFGNKRYLRRRYIDPMTGKDEWRLIHTNGSFLTDSLVQKPPAQNASNGLPGQGQTPGGGPLGANNLNGGAAAATATDGTNNSAAGNPATANPNDPSAVAAAPALNPMAQQRPSDRRIPNGPGFPQPASAPGLPGVGGASMTSAAYDPSDPRTWPPITIATPGTQAGQPQPAGQPQLAAGGQPALSNPPFGAGAAAGTPQPMTGPFGAAQTQIQGSLGQGGLGQGGLGQGNGLGGGNPQPAAVFNPNTIDPNGLAPASIPPEVQNGLPLPANPNTPFAPVANQPAPVQQQPSAAAQANLIQANLTSGGFNPQVPPSPQNATGTTQPNPALPGNNTSNAALTAIDNTLFRPSQAPASGAMGSPGIAGVATKFKGPSIKSYHKRTKYQEWEFVFEPLTNQPGATQPGANPLGPNQNGQTGAAGQNSQQSPNPFAPSSGQQAGGAAQSNPFSTPNPFSPSAAPTQ